MTNQNPSVRDRLILAAMECFLNDEYHKVTTRQIAAEAGTNISMIRYYFGNKEGLYEEMIRHNLEPLLNALDQGILSTRAGFSEYFELYYKAMADNPRFPALILKVLALNQGPGKRFIYQLLERGRSKGREKVEDLKSRRVIDPAVDPDILRIAFVSLAMMPMLLKNIFEEELGRKMDAGFLAQLARFNGKLFSSGLRPMAPASLPEP
jgi:AcrR family transcriptional regulator